jgi:Pumilio-family RNA binding repeat
MSRNKLVFLMKDQFGNYVVQKLFEECDENLKREIYNGVVRSHIQLSEVLKDHYGRFFIRNAYLWLKKAGHHVFGFMDNYFQRAQNSREPRRRSKEDKPRKTKKERKKSPIKDSFWPTNDSWGYSEYYYPQSSFQKTAKGQNASGIGSPCIFMPFIVPFNGAFVTPSYKNYSSASLFISESQIESQSFQNYGGNVWNSRFKTRGPHRFRGNRKYSKDGQKSESNASGKQQEYSTTSTSYFSKNERKSRQSRA